MELNRRSRRLNPEASRRDIQGRFKRTCGSLIHNPLLDDDQQEESFLDLRQRKKVKVDIYSKLLTRGVIAHSARFICKACYCHESILPKQSSTEGNQSDSDESVTDENNEELSSKCIDIGEEISKLISTDVNNLRTDNEINCLQKLNNFEVSDWLSKRPAELLHLLCKLCKIDLNCDSEKKMIVLAKVVELIYYGRSSKLILPNHFLENMLCYSYTNCKSYLNFQGSRSPGGAYTFITTWLKQQAQLQLCSHQDLLRQCSIIAKSWENLRYIRYKHCPDKCNYKPLMGDT